MNQRPLSNGLIGINPDSSRRPRPFNDLEGTPSPPVHHAYGPSAIASLDGLNYRRNVNAPVKEIFSHAPQQFMKGEDVIVLDDIPWPKDNLRYYDEDTDPRITELLAKTPFFRPKDETRKQSRPKPLQSQGGGSSRRSLKAPLPQFAKPSITINKILSPIEYVVGSGRLGKKGCDESSINQAMQLSNTGNKEQFPVSINHHREICDTVKKSIMMMEPVQNSEGGTGDDGHVVTGESGRKQGAVKSDKPKSMQPNITSTTNKLSKKC